MAVGKACFCKTHYSESGVVVMQIIKHARSLIKKDFRLILRDSFLIFMSFFIVVISVVLRFGLPLLDKYLVQREILPYWSIASLASIYPLIISFLAVFQGSLIIGTIFGFALLDEKDDNTLRAMLVTPLSFTQYILFRIFVPMIIATATVIVQVLFIGQAILPIGKLIVIAAGASFIAPIATLFYATFAQNKVQGLAIAKFAGLAGWIILIAWFVSEPWQWLFSLFPPFLVCKAYWMAFAGNNFWWLVLLIGILLQVGLIAGLVHLFKKLVYR